MTAIYKKLSDININDELSFWDKQYRLIDNALGNPISGLPDSISNTYHRRDGHGVWFYAGKYFRNCATVQHLESFIKKRGYILMSIEFFQGKVSLNRIEGEDFDSEFTNVFFYEQMVTSLVSSMDIYSKFISTYYGLPSYKDQGFNRKHFLAQLYRQDVNAYKPLNELLDSKSYKTISSQRHDIIHSLSNLHDEKHMIELSRKSFKVSRRESFNLRKSTRLLYHAYTASKRAVRETNQIVASNSYSYSIPSDLILYAKSGEGYQKIPKSKIPQTILNHT